MRIRMFFELDGKICEIAFATIQESQTALCVFKAFGYSVKEKVENPAGYDILKYLLVKEDKKDEA